MEYAFDYPGQYVSIFMSGDDKGTKKDVGTVAISLPPADRQVSAVEFIEKITAPEKALNLNLATGEGTVEFYGKEPVAVQFQIDEMEYLPARAVLSALNDVLIWDNNLQSAYVSTPEGPVTLYGEIRNINGESVLFISIWEFSNLGYQFDFNYWDDNITISK